MIQIHHFDSQKIALNSDLQSPKPSKMVVSGSECVKPGIPPAKQLAESDDIASSLIVDTVLGFTTHKMAARFRPVKIDPNIVKRSLLRLKGDGDTERVYNDIIDNTGDWKMFYFLNKSRLQVAAFKEHVSTCYDKTLRFKILIRVNSFFKSDHHISSSLLYLLSLQFVSSYTGVPWKDTFTFNT